MEWNKSPYQVAGKRHHQPPEQVKQETNLVARYRGGNGPSGFNGYDQRVATRAMPSLSNLHQDPSPFLTNASMGMDQQQQTNAVGSLDMQHFDENMTVDLQQLFPANGHNHVSQQQQQPMQSHYHHLPSSLAELYAGHQQQPEEKPEPQYPQHPHQQLFQSLQPTAAAGPTMNECYFGESTCRVTSEVDEKRVLTVVVVVVGFPAFHSEASYGFSQQHHQGQMLDDRGELADINDASSFEIQEVSNLLNHASSVVTPPFSSISSARVSMVSPLHAGPGSSRSMMMREDDQDMAMGLGLMAGVGHVCTTPKFSADRRKLCVVEDCKSQARAFNRCKRHGGSKRCSQQGCTKSVQSRGLCIRHGGGSRCQETGCTRAAQSHGHCKMHGGGRPCIVAGCDKKAHLKRLCRKHGGGAKCNVPDCDKWAQRQGMCMTHAKHVNDGGTPRRAKRALPAASSSMQL